MYRLKIVETTVSSVHCLLAHGLLPLYLYIPLFMNSFVQHFKYKFTFTVTYIFTFLCTEKYFKRTVGK